MRRAAWLALCLWMVMGGDVAPASAEAEISTIHLQNGGTIRGEIVVDVPGAPLTVVVAGQAMQITRDTIASIDRAAPSSAAPVAAPAPTAAPAPPPAGPPVYGAPPVYAPPVVAAPVVAPAPAPGTPVALSVDRRGRAAVSAAWSPELQQLVLQRNDVAYSMKRKGLGSPIMMLSFGAVAVIGTAIATTVVYNNYTDCVTSAASSYDYGSCDNTAPIGMGVGYGFGSALLAGGTTFLIVRILKRKALQRRLAVIDQDLRRFNVTPVARLNVGGGMAGLSLRASF